MLNVCITNDLSNDLTCLHSLPTKLTSLILNSPTILPTKVENQNFAKLPKTLTFLQAWNMVGLIKDVIELLPPTLMQIQLPIEFDKTTIRQYYNNPIWEGISLPQMK
jgi:hypothetical protein